MTSLSSNKQKVLDELRKTVSAQEERLEQALKTVNGISEALEKDPEKGISNNTVFWETFNTTITIFGDLLDSYKRYTQELERNMELSNSKIERLTEKSGTAMKKGKKSARPEGESKEEL